ncbi:MAG: hypothetical protein JWL82_373 [Parcubacteria group bacterium]|nr:hypothetical protein [Parcubacteria group bacterium]
MSAAHTTESTGVIDPFTTPGPDAHPFPTDDALAQVLAARAHRCSGLIDDTSYASLVSGR